MAAQEKQIFYAELSDMSVLDDKTLENLKGLMGDEYVSVYEAFVRTADQAMQNLNIAVKEVDIKSAETIAHTLKGSSANIGAKKFSELCAALLADARQLKADNFDTHYTALDNEYRSVRDSIMNLPH